MSPGYCELKLEQVNKVAMLKWTLHTAFLIDAMTLIQMVKFSGSAIFEELSQKWEDIVASMLRQNVCT